VKRTRSEAPLLISYCIILLSRLQIQPWWEQCYGLSRLSSVPPAIRWNGTLKQVTAAPSNSLVRFLYSHSTLYTSRGWQSLKSHSLHGCPSCERQQPTLKITWLLHYHTRSQIPSVFPSEAFIKTRTPRSLPSGCWQLLSYFKNIPPLTEPAGSVHNRPPPVRILSQTNPSPNFITLFSKTAQFNIITPPMPSLPNVIYPPGYKRACCMPRPTHPPWFGQPNNTYSKLQTRRRLTTHFPPASCHFISLRSNYSPQHSVLNYPQTTFFPNVTETEFHAYTKQQVNCSSVSRNL
jgi:hypothetical protein